LNTLLMAFAIISIMVIGLIRMYLLRESTEMKTIFPNFYDAWTEKVLQIEDKGLPKRFGSSGNYDDGDGDSKMNEDDLDYLHKHGNYSEHHNPYND